MPRVDTVLHHLLSGAAERWPHEPAIRLADQVLTYSELEERSNQLARAIRARGATRGERIAVLARKSFEAYAGMYGILKAGCAYVPLDSRAPTERLTYILRDCGVSGVVATPGMKRVVRELRPSQLDITWFHVGDEPPQADGATIVGQEEISSQETRPPADVHAIDTDLAYILYTSGSTGLPKGVMISHLNALTFVRWSREYAAVTQGEHVSGHAPLHFDLSIFDTYATALAGATLLPVPEGTSTFPASQAGWMIDNGINVWYSVPSALTMIAQHPSFEELSFPSLRVVIFAGEVFPAKYLKAWIERVPEASFLNWYGPTETNVVTAYTVTERPEELSQPVPIGRPCENTHVFLEDENRDRVESPAETGEVCVRGSCVAMGYWGDPDKTRASFVDENRQPWLTGKIYRTGDLATMDESGNFHFQGRRDHQIKSRGYRIEIGDVEAALCDVEEVGEAVVVPVPDELIGVRLVAVVALQHGAAAQEADILESVADVLPRYMIPEAVQLRPDLPKTSTGKIDRQAIGESISGA